MIFLLISPALGLKTKEMVHYSEPVVRVNDELFLEQGYSVRVLDMNSNNGEIRIGLYLNGEEVELDDDLAAEDKELEYVRTVVENEGNDDETEIDHRILRITPEGSVKTQDGAEPYSTIRIEQYLDPVEDAGDYLILDKRYSLKAGSKLELAGLYTLEAKDVDDEEVSLELRYDGRLLKDEEVEEGDLFYYSVYSDTGPQTVFLANVKGFFETDEAIMVFLDEVFLQQETVSVNTDVPENIDMYIVSPSGGELKAGSIAIIDYCLDGAYSEVRVLVDGEVLDTRYDVSPGTYKAVTGELVAGTHETTLMLFDDYASVSYYSEEFTVLVDIKDNITGSIAELAGSAVGSLENINSSNSSVNIPSKMSAPSLPSGISDIFSLIVTAGIFMVFAWFFKKFI
ncbi:MAG: hypothetical protein JW705_03290 [Methanosarcinaceae archaeon]|nr:hypothetical protein [Methanosarcinaceae archaeon]